MRPIELIRPGTYTAMDGRQITFAEADLRATAEAYSPALSEAPLVVGHPTTDAPAYGWVETLAFSASLEATPSQVDPAFAEIVEAGRYKKVSASFYLPDAANNPKQGVYYLRHVGFLGAQAPAVKGLRDAQFAGDDSSMITVELSEPPQRNEERHMAEKLDPADEIAAGKQRLADNEAAFAERVKLFDGEQRRRRHEGIAQFAAEQVKAGRVLPKDKDGLVAFMDAVPADLTVDLAEGDTGAKTKHDGLGWLRAFIAGLPAQVEFGEHARADDHAQEGVASFAAPPGFSVDTWRIELHRKAEAYRRAHPNTDYLTAVRAVS